MTTKTFIKKPQHHVLCVAKQHTKLFTIYEWKRAFSYYNHSTSTPFQVLHFPQRTSTQSNGKDSTIPTINYCVTNVLQRQHKPCTIMHLIEVVFFSSVEELFKKWLVSRPRARHRQHSNPLPLSRDDTSGELLSFLLSAFLIWVYMQTVAVTFFSNGVLIKSLVRDVSGQNGSIKWA